MDELILVGDVGGTNVRFALASPGAVLSHVHKEPAHDCPDFESALARYLSRLEKVPARACLALAGPISDGIVKLTNRPWVVSRRALSTRFGFSNLTLVNDFAAMARGAVEADDDQFAIVKTGVVDRTQPILVAGAGTGFGAATLLPDRGGWRVLSGEGGFQQFCPTSELEWALHQALRTRNDFVSLELVTGGGGHDALVRAFSAVLGVRYEPIDPLELSKRAAAGEAFAKQLCALRADAVMGACGDMALTNGARGAVILAGGVSQSLERFLAAPSALARFQARGPLSSFLQSTPVHLLLDPFAALRGAALLFTA